MNTIKRLFLPLALIVVGMFLVGTGMQLAPKLVHAQTSSSDLYAFFSGTSISNSTPATVVAGVSGKRIRVKDITAGAVTAGPIGFYDGATYTTNIAGLIVPANTTGEISNSFFLGGTSAGGKVLTSGNALTVAAPNGGAIYVTVRYELD